MTEEFDDGLHRSAVYRVGNVRLWIHAVGQTEPFVHIEGDVNALHPEEQRSVGVVLKHLTDLVG